MKTSELSGRRLSAWVLLLVLLVLLPGCGRERPPWEGYLVGAHYYIWYPSNLEQGFLRGVLDPPQQPELGFYDSSDISVIEQHIAWCSQYGIDFLTINWWPGHERNRIVTECFLRAANIADIRFCIFYDTKVLAYDDETEATVFTEDLIERFLNDMRMFADKFFDHPSYLKIRGRPVIILYLTRTFSGKYRKAMQRMRFEMAFLGIDPFVIADEVFWGVIAEHENNDGFPCGAVGPQLERISLFDAVVGYNMYDSSQKSHAGYGADSSFVKDVQRIFAEYSEAVGPDIRFVPNIMPGYNDRGVRLVRKHYVIPGQWAEGQPEGSFLAKSFDRLAFPYLDPKLNMILITSWNEWNEDTNIEPVKVCPPTSRDSSESGDVFTQGFQYTGYGTRYLEVVRDKVVAICGQVTDSIQDPVSGIVVSAWDRARIVAQSRTDSRGYFTLSRLRMPEGKYMVGLDREGMRRVVTVRADRSVTEIDFVLGSF